MSKWRLWVLAAYLSLAGGIYAGSAAAYSGDFAGGTFSFTGYIREYLAINLENKPDILANGDKLEGQWDLSTWPAASCCSTAPPIMDESA